MEPGDLLFAFTDGVLDAVNGDNIQFGAERLANCLAVVEGSATDLLKNIEANLSHFVSQAEQFDDVTMLGIKRCL